MEYEITYEKLQNIKNNGDCVYLSDFGTVLKPKYRQCSDFIGRVLSRINSEDNMYQILIYKPELERYFEIYYKEIFTIKGLISGRKEPFLKLKEKFLNRV